MKSLTKTLVVVIAAALSIGGIIVAEDPPPPPSESDAVKTNRDKELDQLLNVETKKDSQETLGRGRGLLRHVSWQVSSLMRYCPYGQFCYYRLC